MDRDYSGRPLPELTEADVRRATDSLGEDLVGEILQLSDGTLVSFARGGWYELVPGRVDFDKPVDADRIPPETRRLYEQHEATHSRRRREARSRWHRFADAVRQQAPGSVELMNQTREMLEVYGEVIAQEVRQKARQKARQEARREGELRGRVLIIEGFLGRDVPWSTIEAATGIDEAAFRRLKHQVEAADDATPHPD